MSTSFVVSCCSTADISVDYAKKRDIQYSCFHYYLDDVSYSDDMGQSMPIKEFYQRLRDGQEPRTSQINENEYVEYFKTFLDKGLDILHLSLSSGISGTYNSARLAAENLKESYPDRKIYIIDTLCASAGFGLIVDKACDLRDQEFSIDECRDWLEDHKLELQHWFFSMDLTFFVKGGRISKVSGWFGTALNICPLLNVNDEGRLIPRYKLRGKKKCYTAIVDKMEELAFNGTNYSGKVFFSHADCLEDVKAVEELVRARFPKVSDIEIFDIGTTIGSHTGPGTVAMFFWGEKRTK